MNSFAVARGNLYEKRVKGKNENDIGPIADFQFAKSACEARR
jgi:hypothetical protein